MNRECETCGNEAPDEGRQCPHCGSPLPPVPAAGRRPAARFVTVNLKQDLPTVDQALDRLREALADARAQGAWAVKLIHGYGSQGRGGAIRPAVRAALLGLTRRGAIRGFVPGEAYTPGHELVRGLAARWPAVRQDRDLGRHNEGITVAFF